MAQDFYNLLYNGYTGEYQLMSSLYRNGLDALRPPADMGIDVVQPSVNASQRSFSAREGKVVFGLGGIKNVGDSAITEIMDARKDGEYVSLFDMCYRVDLRKVTKRVLEALIKGGACDCFGVARAALLAALDVLVDGRFIEAQKDYRLRFKGSRNQRIIDVPASLREGHVVCSSYDDVNQDLE